MNKECICGMLAEIGASWAVTSEKCILPNDGYDAKPSYHVHPDVSYPHQNNILRFYTLRAVGAWCRKMQQARENDVVVTDGYDAWYEG